MKSLNETSERRQKETADAQRRVYEMRRKMLLAIDQYEAAVRAHQALIDREAERKCK